MDRSARRATTNRANFAHHFQRHKEMKLRHHPHQSGFTLAEMMTAMAIAVVIFAAIITASLALQKSFNAVDNYFATHIQQIRIIDYLNRDVKRALIVTTSADQQTVTLTIPKYVVQSNDQERRRRTRGDNCLFSRLSPKQTTRINLMKVSFTSNERGNALLCAVCTIFIVSVIAANVLLNCTTRYNQASNQVRSWNEALYAAESGADIAYNEVRKIASNPSSAFGASNGWATSGTTYTSGTTTFGTNGLRTSQTVDLFYSDPTTGNAWYRIRSKGTSLLQGLKRTGMDDRLSNGNRFVANASTRGDGDTLLRKIDFKYDHFTATYGPTGDGTNNAIVAVSPAPQLSRRIERS